MGVDIETIIAGDNTTFPRVGQKVTLHYVLTLRDGKKVDSSRDRGTPFVFQSGIGQVITGLDQGVARLSLGQRAKLTITPDVGYGLVGVTSVIPPNSMLFFDVEIINIE